MGIVNDLRKEVEKGKRQIVAAERIMERSLKPSPIAIVSAGVKS